MSLMSRAMRGVREHLRTQLVSVATVAMALFCLGGALLAVENVDALAARWGAPVRVTVYLADDATAPQVEQLRGALTDLPEVSSVRYVSPSDVRSQLSREGEGSLGDAPAELFPATLELRLTQGSVDPVRIRSLADRVRRLPSVSGVETYQGMTEQLHSLFSSGRTAAVVVGLVVLLCAIAVVSNTIRLSLSARMREVEVLRLVGASPQYVRAPFVMEGALLGGGGAVLALAGLACVFFFLRTRLEGTLGGSLGIRPVFLSWYTAMLFLAGGALLGSAGSGLALRKWLRV